MHFPSALFIAIVLVVLIHPGLNVEEKAQVNCPNGGEIFASGIDPSNQEAILNVHNKYRSMILKGQLRGQPRGKNMKMLSYDKELERLASEVTKSCQLKHVLMKDDRFPFVGQNLHVQHSASRTNGSDWPGTIKKWFEENKFYRYPNKPSARNGHYTQIVSENTTHIGCNYASFYDVQTPKTPYTNMYVCNYGPAGNMAEKPPYQ